MNVGTYGLIGKALGRIKGFKSQFSIYKKLSLAYNTMDYYYYYDRSSYGVVIFQVVYGYERRI